MHFKELRSTLFDQTLSFLIFQENLAKHGDVRFGSDYSDKLVEQEDLVGFDLCVLATSQHTVITYGTFGLWGALLAGGEVLAAKGRNNIPLTEVTSAFSAPWF